MKKIFKIALLLITVSSLCGSCHKYSEDPFISFRRPSGRIVGIWKFISYQRDGKEQS